jgi:Fur family transcriptional regulator, ferric uptake regulator
MMDPKNMPLGEKIRTAIEEQSQRQTRTKGQIADRLAELAEERADFTVEALLNDLRRLSPHIGRATVYRAVEMLVNLGLLNRIDFADGSHTYRACGNDHHHHLTCVQCHRVVDIDVCIPREQFDQISEQTDFLIEGHSLTLYGLCIECQKLLDGVQ